MSIHCLQKECPLAFAAGRGRKEEERGEGEEGNREEGREKEKRGRRRITDQTNYEFMRIKV